MDGGPIQGLRSYKETGSRQRLLELLAVFLVFSAPNLIYFAAGYEGALGDYGVLDFVVDTTTRIGWCALVALLLTRRDGFDWKLPRSAGEWGKEFGWGLLLIMAIVGCAYVVAYMVGLLGIEETTQSSEPMQQRTLITFLLFTPIIGLHEELLFRVYAQTRLTQVLKSKKVLPVFIASGIFAAMHGYSLIGTLVILIFGLVMGTSYQANGKIPRLVIAHTLWNVGVTLLGLLGL